MIDLQKEMCEAHAQIARNYLGAFQFEMSSAELIGCYRSIVETGEATDAEEATFLDLINPYQVQ